MSYRPWQQFPGPRQTTGTFQIPASAGLVHTHPPASVQMLFSIQATSSALCPCGSCGMFWQVKILMMGEPKSKGTAWMQGISALCTPLGAVETTLKGFKVKSSVRGLPEETQTAQYLSMTWKRESLEIRIKEDIKCSRKTNVTKAA